MKIQKNMLYGILALLVVLVMIFFMVKFGASKPDTNTNDNPVYLDGDVQNVVLGMKDYNYYPNTIAVQAGKPVRISLDSTVSGCLRDFTVKEFGVRKYLATPSDYVEFTPTKPGRYAFACSMNMGTGVLIVE